MTEPGPSAPQRLLRRNRSNRVAAGVASGLGEYFGIDPVLFRVLFATSAFFGGAGILAYLLAWAAIPEAGTERAPIDGWVQALRRRKVPVWAVVIVGGVVLWAAAFSWWAPGPFFPVVAVVVLLVVVFARREMQSTGPVGPSDGVNLTKAPPSAPGPSAPDRSAADVSAADPSAPPAEPPTWVRDARAWFDESRAAARERRRRSFPVRLGVLIALVVALTSLGVADGVGGIQLQWYFYTVLIILAVGMLVAIATRRWSWSLVSLVPLATIGAVAFAGTDASLSDGIGQREWTPVSATSAHYRLAFGQGVLDLRHLQPPAGPTTMKVTLGAGQVKIIAPRTMNLTVHADVHAGQLDVDHERDDHGRAHGGIEFTRTIDPPAGATGAPVRVDVELADGEIDVQHR